MEKTIQVQAITNGKFCNKICPGFCTESSYCHLFRQINNSYVFTDTRLRCKKCLDKHDEINIKIKVNDHNDQYCGLNCNYNDQFCILFGKRDTNNNGYIRCQQCLKAEELWEENNPIRYKENNINTNIPRGLWAIKHLSGKEIKTERIMVKASFPIFRGDPIQIKHDGTVVSILEELEDEHCIIAIVSSCYCIDRHSLSYLPGNCYGYLEVWTDKDIVFGIQADGIITENDIGSTKNFIEMETGHEITGISGYGLESVGKGNELKILNKVNRIDNHWGEFVDLEVVIIKE